MAQLSDEVLDYCMQGTRLSPQHQSASQSILLSPQQKNTVQFFEQSKRIPILHKQRRVTSAIFEMDKYVL